jgi:hypothetical protein
MSQLEIKFNNLESKKFLEDVPNWEEKLQLRKLALYNRDMAKEGKLFFSYEDGANAEVTKLNKEYGRIVARVEKSLKGYRVVIDAPYRDAFKDILVNQEEGDEILPQREKEVVEMNTKEDKQKAA